MDSKNKKIEVDYAWDHMYNILESEMPQKKRKRRFFWIFFGSLIGILFLSILLNTNRSSNKDHSTNYVENNYQNYHYDKHSESIADVINVPTHIKDVSEKHIKPTKEKVLYSANIRKPRSCLVKAPLNKEIPISNDILEENNTSYVKYQASKSRESYDYPDKINSIISRLHIKKEHLESKPFIEPTRNENGISNQWFVESILMNDLTSKVNGLRLSLGHQIHLSKVFNPYISCGLEHWFSSSLSEKRIQSPLDESLNVTESTDSYKLSTVSFDNSRLISINIGNEIRYSKSFFSSIGLTYHHLINRSVIQEETINDPKGDFSMQNTSEKREKINHQLNPYISLGYRLKNKLSIQVGYEYGTGLWNRNYSNKRSPHFLNLGFKYSL